ncbi:hypothetical protein NEMIN01_1362 [Nematocida minor]|uniref:uncharacterized protein n=1 Tax=Nematocida minor TaxID=1912983 RepID=UPI00221F76A2|nr:uncharacterized protein NEMIN01_1362 [Nematocida minor]KAI5191093.1 hypothetical protein NEMIN01_1362 [Nematocida minor]
MSKSLQGMEPEEILNNFIFKSTVRMSILSREINKLRSTDAHREKEYNDLCIAILKHADDTRVILHTIENLSIPVEEKISLRESVKMINLESVIYSMGHALIEMKGLHSVSRINTCFVRRTKKFWIDLDNIETVFGMIIPHLPVYIFGDDGSGKISSFISSVYFDTNQFYLYDKRIRRDQGAKSLRIRSYGESSIISYVELKTHEDGWTGERSTKKRFLVHTKLIPELSSGVDIWEEIKTINSDAEAFNLYQEVIDLIRDLSLKPVVKTVYSRTAFQFPEDSSIRISLDTKLAMWNGECGKSFPYAILEVKLEEGNEKDWILELMNSPLVMPVDKFSKYLHGCSVHYDTVPSIPYWYNQIIVPIKRQIDLEHSPTAIPKLSHLEDEITEIIQGMKDHKTVPQAEHVYQCTNTSAEQGSSSSSSGDFIYETDPRQGADSQREHPTFDCAEQQTAQNPNRGQNEIQNLNINREKTMKPEENNSQESFFQPTALKQTTGQAIPYAASDKPIAVPVRIEPKVFFANERTFLSWLHFAIFIGGIGAALMGLGDVQAALSGVCFVIVSIIFSIYALYLYIWRTKKIKEKNAGPYDDVQGPIILVAVFLSAMVTSVFFKFPLK